MAVDSAATCPLIYLSLYLVFGCVLQRYENNFNGILCTPNATVKSFSLLIFHYSKSDYFMLCLAFQVTECAQIIIV